MVICYILYHSSGVFDRCHIKGRQCPNMTIDVYWDVKHQTYTTLDEDSASELQLTVQGPVVLN